jgi:hypothetical protein
MSNDHEARRQHIKARLEHAERTLCATRSSAGGHSRAIRLHLEREIHARNRDLALLDLAPGTSGVAPLSPDKK